MFDERKMIRKYHIAPPHSHNCGFRNKGTHICVINKTSLHQNHSGLSMPFINKACFFPLIPCSFVIKKNGGMHRQKLRQLNSFLGTHVLPPNKR